MLEKFLTKDNVIIVIVAVGMALYFIFSSNYFATRLEVSQLKAEILQQKIELMKYSDDKDAEVLKELDSKYEKILQKLDQLRK